MYEKIICLRVITLLYRKSLKPSGGESNYEFVLRKCFTKEGIGIDILKQKCAMSIGKVYKCERNVIYTYFFDCLNQLGLQDSWLAFLPVDKSNAKIDYFQVSWFQHFYTISTLLRQNFSLIRLGMQLWKFL